MSPIRPVMREPLAEEPASGPGFLLPFGHRHSLPGPSCARWGIRLSSRSAYRQTSRRTPSGLSRSACDRCGRGGRPLNPGDGGALPAGQVRPAGTCRLPAAGPCSPAFCLPPAEVLMTRRHRGFTCVHPSGLPQPVVSRMEREPLGLSPGFAPCGYPQRTPGRGRSLRTGPGTTSPTSVDPLRRVPLITCDLVSHDLVDPRGVGRREVELDAGMGQQPLCTAGALWVAQVVADHVDVQAGLGRPVDLVQEVPEVDGPVLARTAGRSPCRSAVFSAANRSMVPCRT